MSFNDQTTSNATGTLNNSNNNNTNNNTNSSNLFSVHNSCKSNPECKNSQNCASNCNNYFDLDFNDCDLFGGNNNHHLNMMGGANHHQQQNNFFFEGAFNGCATTSAVGQGHVYFAPMKYGYLGQQEEQIFHDKQINNFSDFEFSTQFFQPAHQNHFGLNAVNSLNNMQGNTNYNHQSNNGNQSENQNNGCLAENSNENQLNKNNKNGENQINHGANHMNGFIANNFLFSTYNNNNAVDIADLFPSEPVPKLENKQTSHPNEYYMDNDNDFSPSHTAINNDNIHSQLPPIITKTECSGNSCNTGLLHNNGISCNNFINEGMISDRSAMHMMHPYAGYHPYTNQQPHYAIMNDHSHLSNIYQNQHILNNGFQCSNQMTQYHHIGNNAIHAQVPIMHQNQQPQNITVIPGIKNNVFSIIKDQQKEKKKDYDKNICRYITRQVVRSFSSPEFKSNVLCIISEIYPETPTQNIIQIYKDTTEFFLGEIENLSGFRALKDILVVNSDVDGNILATQKRIFREFMSWYLKERYFRNIINGNMKDKLAFIRYKNKIMLHYINKPQNWNSNKKKNAKLSSPTQSNGTAPSSLTSINLSKQEQ